MLNIERGVVQDHWDRYQRFLENKKKSKKQSVSTVVDFNHFIQVTWPPISG